MKKTTFKKRFYRDLLLSGFLFNLILISVCRAEKTDLVYAGRDCGKYLQAEIRFGRGVKGVPCAIFRQNKFLDKEGAFSQLNYNVGAAGTQCYMWQFIPSSPTNRSPSVKYFRAMPSLTVAGHGVPGFIPGLVPADENCRNIVSIGEYTNDVRIKFANYYKICPEDVHVLLLSCSSANNAADFIMGLNGWDETNKCSIGHIGSDGRPYSVLPYVADHKWETTSSSCFRPGSASPGWLDTLPDCPSWEKSGPRASMAAPSSPRAPRGPRLTGIVSGIVLVAGLECAYQEQNGSELAGTIRSVAEAPGKLSDLFWGPCPGDHGPVAAALGWCFGKGADAYCSWRGGTAPDDLADMIPWCPPSTPLLRGCASPLQTGLYRTDYGYCQFMKDIGNGGVATRCF